MIKNELEPRLEQKLKVMAQSAERDPHAAANGRVRFLEQAREIKAQIQMTQPVSPKPNPRHIGWNLFFSRKELKQMSILTTIVLIVSLLVGGTGVTLAAAQTSQPNDALYSVKLASEDVRYALATREETRLSLALAYAENRAEEIGQAVKAGDPVPEPVVANWEEHLQNALRVAAGMQEEDMAQALLRIREQIRAEIQRIDQDNPSSQEPAVQRVRAMLETQTGLIEGGLTDPVMFREQQRAKNPGINEPGNPWTIGTPTPGCGYGPGPGSCTMVAPGDDVPGNPWTTGTPTPGSGYGPGPKGTTNPPGGMNHGDGSNGQNGNNGGGN